MNVAELSNVGVPLWVVIMLVCIVALGGGAGLAHVVTSFASKRKMQAEGEKSEAEAEKINVDATVALVSAATALVAPLEARLGSAEGRIGTLERDIHERDRLAAEHAGWDYIVEEKAKEAGIVLPERPPLRPPA